MDQVDRITDWQSFEYPNLIKLLPIKTTYNLYQLCWISKIYRSSKLNLSYRLGTIYLLLLIDLEHIWSKPVKICIITPPGNNGNFPEMRLV